MDLFQPDAKAIYGHAGDATVEYGRIIVNMASDDSIAYQYTVTGNPIQVTDNEVVLDFFVAENQTLTVYAVNRHKIESFETDVTAGLVPMQPSAHRSIPVINGFFVDKPKPVDFTCTELDLSGMPFGTSTSSNIADATARFASHSHTGTRAVLTLVANGSFDPDASVMTYYYAHSDELVRPAPYSPQHCTVEGPHFDVQSGQAVPHCSDYYRLALHRQHTNSTLFRDFSPAIGKAYLINNPGYYVACVAASDKDASSVHQDGVVIARFQKKDVKDKSSCPAAGTPSTPHPSIPSTNPLYPSFTTFAAPLATTTAPSYMTPTHAQGTWSTARLSVARTQLAATSVGNVAIFAGGLVGPNAVDLYNSASGTWSTAQLSVGRYDLSATSVGNVAIFAGGNAGGMFRVALLQGVRLLLLICVRRVCMRRVVCCCLCLRCSRLPSHASRCSWRIFQCCGLVQQCIWHVVDCAAQCGAR